MLIFIVIFIFIFTFLNYLLFLYLLSIILYLYFSTFTYSDMFPVILEKIQILKMYWTSDIYPTQKRILATLVGT